MRKARFYRLGGIWLLEVPTKEGLANRAYYSYEGLALLAFVAGFNYRNPPASGAVVGYPSLLSAI